MREFPASAEDAVELFLERKKSGENVDPIAFAAQYPQFEPELSSALDALLEVQRAARADELADGPLPERIGPFRILREIGRGGMGLVLEAIEEPLNRRVALKVLPPELLSSPSARMRFRREAELAARLDHSGIATIYGAGVEDERPWIAMRYVDGVTLARAIDEARDSGERCVQVAAHATGRRESARTDRSGRDASTRRRDTAHTDATGRDPLASRASSRADQPSATTGRGATLAVASLVAKVARALHSAHEQGVVHRDIKPSNIIITPDGSPVLLDFGLAIAEDPDGRSLTRTGEAPGTPAYLAPETVSGEMSRPDAQADVYSLGITLYEALALRRPFDAPTRVALYHAILAGTARDVRSVNRDVSRDLAVVTAVAMERDRPRRYRSALALAEDLEACVERRPIAVRPVPLSGRILRWARREPRQASLAGLLGAAVIALALFGGNYWASRGVVHAAERVARERECEQALTEGYVALQQAPPTSEAAFLRVLALDPSNLDATAGRILARIGTQREKEALEMLASAPSTPGFDALRACCRQVRVTQDARLSSLSHASSLDLMLIGDALVIEAVRAPLSKSREINARALAMMNEAVVRAPTAREFMHVQRAYAASDAGNERVSRSAASALLSLWPDAYQALCAAGTALSDFDPIEARPILERAVRLDPSGAGPRQVLGKICLQLGELEESERWLWLALARLHRVEIYNALGCTLAMRGCLDEARRAFGDGVAVACRDLEAWKNLGEAENDTGDHAASVYAEEVVLQRDPMNADAHGIIAEALLSLGDLGRARVHIEHAVALEPTRVDFYGVLARVLSALGDVPAARDAIEAGLERQPEYAPLLQMRSGLAKTK
jgi:serine/threonine protein kinase/Flp pilus assembly protein TadD